MAKEVTVLGIEGAFLRGVRLEERNGAFVCTEVESWPLVAGAADVMPADGIAAAEHGALGNPPVLPGNDPLLPIVQRQYFLIHQCFFCHPLPLFNINI